MTAPRELPAVRLPLFLNPAAGSANEALAAVCESGRFDVHEVEPARLEAELRAALERGATRIVVAGGDGTIGTAASVVAGTPVVLGVLPAGTLNHFARDLGIPTDLDEAAAIAVGPSVRTVDVGFVNGHLFLNTSSVGAYVTFVRLRERLERRLGYRMASLVAIARIFYSMRSVRVELEEGGERRIYRAPLVFFGVGERELKVPFAGSRVPGGRRGLHVMVASGRSRARFLALALDAVVHGVRSAARSLEFESLIVSRCRILFRRPRGNVAIDGEIVLMIAPLEYTLARDALLVAAPPAAPPADAVAAR